MQPLAVEVNIGTTFSDPWLYIAITACGLLAFGVRALAKGDLRTGREVDVNNERVRTLEEALRNRDEQVTEALAVLPQIAGVLAELHPSKNGVGEGP